MSSLFIRSGPCGCSMEFERVVAAQELFCSLPGGGYSRSKYKQTYLGVLWALLRPLWDWCHLRPHFRNSLKFETGWLPIPSFVLSDAVWACFSHPSRTGESLLIPECCHHPARSISTADYSGIQPVLVALFDFLMGFSSSSYFVLFIIITLIQRRYLF